MHWPPGNYLPDEPYSDWTKDTRITVEGYLRQAVHTLRRLYLSSHGEVGEEQVLVLLRTYLAHPPSGRRYAQTTYGIAEQA